MADGRTRVGGARREHSISAQPPEFAAGSKSNALVLQHQCRAKDERSSGTRFGITGGDMSCIQSDDPCLGALNPVPG